jgi:IPT/TIG domain
MSVLKRPIGRVMGAVVGASMMMLGLAAPASAVLGPITFAPASGPDGCVLVITGTDFEGPDVDTVEVGGVAATFEIQSDTEIWAAAPAGASGFVTVERAATSESVSSGTQFSNTAGAGACGATITSFSPACGLVGTTVTITGTNLIQASFAGGDVEFSPFVGTNGVDATHTGASEDPTSLTVLVPSGAADGPISVLTDVGEVFSATDFNVVTDVADCAPVGAPEHARTVTLRLAKHLIAKGTVTADPELAECIAGVKVKIQRKKGGAWKSVGTATTNDLGKYKRSIKDKPGKYRARIGKLSIGDPVTDVCLGDRSPVVRHSH